MAETMHMEIPQDVLAALKTGIQDLAQYMRVAAAISCFQEKKLSLGKAAQLAGYNRQPRVTPWATYCPGGTFDHSPVIYRWGKKGFSGCSPELINITPLGYRYPLICRRVQTYVSALMFHDADTGAHIGAPLQ